MESIPFEFHIEKIDNTELNFLSGEKQKNLTA